MVMSAVSSVSTPGVLVTTIPRPKAAVRQHCRRRFRNWRSVSAGGQPSYHLGIDPVGHGRNEHVGTLAAAIVLRVIGGRRY